jgi:hypothetical protein
MQALAGHPQATGHLGDGGSLDEHLEDGPMTLLHDPELHQHDGPPPADDANVISEGGSDPPGADGGV